MSILLSKAFFFTAIFLILFKNAHSQTQLTLILKTTQPIDSAFIVHYTNQESRWLLFKDTLTLNFKTRGIDFYHINYTAKGKIFNARLYLDSGNIEITSRIEKDKLLVENVIGSPIYNKIDKWKRDFNTILQNKDSIGMDTFLLSTYAENIDNIYSFSIGRRYLDIHQNNTPKLYALLPLIARQNDELKSQFGYSFLNDRLQGIIRNNIVTLSDFELINLKNKKIHVKTNSPRFTILDFWFVGCLPCFEDHEKMKDILPVLKQKQTEFISIQ